MYEKRTYDIWRGMVKRCTDPEGHARSLQILKRKGLLRVGA